MNTQEENSIEWHRRGGCCTIDESHAIANELETCIRSQIGDKYML